MNSPIQDVTFTVNANSQADFNQCLSEASNRRYNSSPGKLRMALGQLTPTNILTMTVKSPVGTSLDKQRKLMERKRTQIYATAKDMNLSVQTTCNKDYSVLMIRLNPTWPVARS